MRAELAPTGVLRAHINLGNPVLTHGTPDDPGGVTVDLATEAAARLGVPVEFTCVQAARHSFEALVEHRADIAFLAVEPARAAQVAFTAPYVLIEGVYVVPAGSALRRADDVDRSGVRVGVKEGSAYDLHLSRELRHDAVARVRVDPPGRGLAHPGSGLQALLEVDVDALGAAHELRQLKCAGEEQVVGRAGLDADPHAVAVDVVDGPER